MFWVFPLGFRVCGLQFLVLGLRFRGLFVLASGLGFQALSSENSGLIVSGVGFTSRVSGPNTPKTPFTSLGSLGGSHVEKPQTLHVHITPLDSGLWASEACSKLWPRLHCSAECASTMVLRRLRKGGVRCRVGAQPADPRILGCACEGFRALGFGTDVGAPDFEKFPYKVSTITITIIITITITIIITITIMESF